MAHKGFCDGCGRETQVKKLPWSKQPFHGNSILCRKCWAKEMSWRRDRNKKLERQNRFSILKFS